MKTGFVIAAALIIVAATVILKGAGAKLTN